MPRTYEGILRGNRIDWTQGQPTQDRPVRVQVTVLDEEGPQTRRGERMAAALARLAERGGITSIEDPKAWQREMRQERELPGREA